MNNFFRLLTTALAIAMAAGILTVLAAIQPAKAAFPGTNGKIAFERDPDDPRGKENPEIYTISFTGAVT